MGKLAENYPHRVGWNAADYLNRDDVRNLLHIKDKSKIPVWEPCAVDPSWSYKLQKEGSTYIYNVLKASGIKILVFSGTTDLMVSTYGTERWIQKLGWDV